LAFVAVKFFLCVRCVLCGSLKLRKHVVTRRSSCCMMIAHEGENMRNHCWIELIICAAMSLLFASLSEAAPGDLDLSFSSDGKVTTGWGLVNPTNTLATDVTISNGKIVTAGYILQDSGIDEIMVVRYASDGSLDPQFANGGILVTSYNGLNSDAYAVE